MITLFRLFRLWQLKTKWKLSFYHFLDSQLKNPEELQKKIVHEIAELLRSE